MEIGFGKRARLWKSLQEPVMPSFKIYLSAGRRGVI